MWRALKFQFLVHKDKICKYVAGKGERRKMRSGRKFIFFSSTHQKIKKKKRTKAAT